MIARESRLIKSLDVSFGLPRHLYFIFTIFWKFLKTQQRFLVSGNYIFLGKNKLKT